MLKKLRGAVGTAVTWGLAWALGGFVLVMFVYIVGLGIDGLPFWEIAPLLAFRTGLWGLASGAVFAGALAAIHPRREFEELQPATVGLWGAAAGLLIPAAVIAVALGVGAIQLSPDLIGSVLFVFGGLGLTTAAGTIKLAQVGTRSLRSVDADQLLAP